MPFDEPGRVVDLAKHQQGLTEFLDGVEGPHPEQVLLEGANKALRAAIPLGSPHEGRRTLDAEEGKFLLESIGHVLAPSSRKPSGARPMAGTGIRLHPLQGAYDWPARVQARPSSP